MTSDYMTVVAMQVLASYPGHPRIRENKRGKALLIPVYFRKCGKGLGTRLVRYMYELRVS